MKQKKIKLLLVLPFFYPHRGGSQKYAEEIYYSMMLKHENIKVDVLCYNTDNSLPYEKHRGFNIHRIPCWHIIKGRFALPNPISLLIILAKLSKNKYNYVNTHIRFFDPTWWVWIYAKRINAKSIYTGHVATHPIHQNPAVRLIAVFVDKTIAKLSLKQYDYITITNKAAITFFREILGVKKKMHLIYGGVDTKYFSHSNDPRISFINKRFEKDDVIITYVGRVIWTKGVTYLYETAQEIVENYKDVYFIIAGPGELEEILKTQIKQGALEDKIFATGDLKYAQVKELLSKSDIFVNPSHHNEGFPNTILEAGASSCFVIATDNAGTKEVVKHKETGFLVPQRSTKELEKAIIWALENPKERRRIAQNMHQLVLSQFDWKDISEKLYKILQ